MSSAHLHSDWAKPSVHPAPRLLPAPLTSSLRSNVAAPTEQEVQAIEQLQDQDDQNVLAYLKFARCLDPSSCPGNGYGTLSGDQVQAIFSLRGYTDDDIRIWLATLRALRNSETSGLSRSNQISTADSKALTSQVSHGWPAPTQNVVTSEHRAERFPKSHLAHDCRINPPFKPSKNNATSDSPNPASCKPSSRKPFLENVSAKIPRRYYCTICPEQRSYQNHSDWKKHEKEHEVTYVCMYGNQRELSDQTLLPMVHENVRPEETLYESHKPRQCAFSCKRRDQMVTHLNRNHMIYDNDQGRRMADQWRRKSGKRFWSCGFCVSLFLSFQERLEHIRTKHFEQQQSLSEWKTSNVIQGLLLQPGFDTAWRNLVQLHDGCDIPYLFWENAAMEGLQYKLEMASSDEQELLALVQAAYHTSRPSQSAAMNGYRQNMYDDAVTSLAPLTSTTSGDSGTTLDQSASSSSMNPASLSDLHFTYDFLERPVNRMIDEQIWYMDPTLFSEQADAGFDELSTLNPEP